MVIFLYFLNCLLVTGVSKDYQRNGMDVVDFRVVTNESSQRRDLGASLAQRETVLPWFDKLAVLDRGTVERSVQQMNLTTEGFVSSAVEVLERWHERLLSTVKLGKETTSWVYHESDGRHSKDTLTSDPWVINVRELDLLERLTKA